MKIATPSNNSYRSPIIIAVIIHIILFSLIFLSFEFSTSIKPAIHSEQNGSIQAVAVKDYAFDDAVKKLKLDALRKKKQDQERKKELQKQEQAAKEERQQEEKRLADLKKEQQKAQEKIVAEQKAAEKKLALLKQQKLAEKEKLKKVEQQKQEKLKQQQLAKKTAQEKQKKIAKQKQLELDREVKEELAGDLQEQINDDSKQLAAAKSDEIENMVTRYMAMIKTQVESNWSKPDGTDPNLHCRLKVRLLPGGTVVTVSIDKSSGDPALDQSAMNAVYKAQPLPVPPDAELFEQYFRNFIITG